MDDWDLFERIRPPTPPPPKPARTRSVTKESESSEAPVENGDIEEVGDFVAIIGTQSGKTEKECSPESNDVADEPLAPPTPPPPTRTPARVAPRPGTIVINGRVTRIVEDRPSILRLDHLPPEVLEQIFRRLDGAGMRNLALSCKRLYDVSFTDCIWSERIEREYGLKPESYRGVGITARAFYQQILFHYGWSLGCWIRLVKNYGGLIKVVVENGMIVGKEVQPPENPNVEQSVTFKDLFCVKLDSKGLPKLQCLKEQFNNDASAVRRRRRVYSTGQSSSEDDVEDKVTEKGDKWDLFANINSDGVEWADEQKMKEEEEARRKAKEEEEKAAEERKKRGVVHAVEISHVEEAHCRRKSSNDKSATEHFHVECLCPLTHKRDFEDFRQEDNTFRFLAMTKYDTIRSYGSRFTYQRFTVKPDLVFDQAPATGVTSAIDESAIDAPAFFPLQPGIFKGTYGGHGIEFVSIEKRSPFQYEAVKISGDPNVPFSKVSFCGDLRDFLFPTEDDQLSLDKLKPMEPDRGMDAATCRSLQPYRSPVDCFVRSPFTLPDQCRARFTAEYQVSEWGYTAPQFIKAHLVVFTQDLLALIILDIKSVVIFHRLPFADLGLPPVPTKIFRPIATSVEASAQTNGTAEAPAEAAVVEPPPKPRRAIFRWPPPKFGEALGDIDS